MRSSVACSLLALASSAYAQGSVAALVAQLRNAPTQVDRIAALNDSDVSYSFAFPNILIS